MNAEIEQFANTLATTDFRTLVHTYKGRVPAGVTVDGLAKILIKTDGWKAGLRSDWKGDGRDKDGLYFIRNESGFEIFNGERGAKHWRESFSDPQPAIVAWIDALLNALSYSAPDTKIK